MKSRTKVVPVILTILILVVIICLFASIKQPLVVCDRKIEDNLGIIISEVLETTIDGNDIESMVLIKTISVPDKYINDIDNVVLSLEKAYEYLADDVSISVEDNNITIFVDIDDDQTIILNNIKFSYNDRLRIEINSNTKSTDVITLKVGDKYTEGELMTRLKNNNYSCR